LKHKDARPNTLEDRLAPPRPGGRVGGWRVDRAAGRPGGRERPTGDRCGAFPVAVRPKSGLKVRFTARKHYCVT
jgi:hypothetical protein